MTAAPVMAAEFDSLAPWQAAVTALHDAAIPATDAYSPFACESGDTDHALTLTALAAGLLGGALGLWVQWFTNERSYPLNVGGRPRFPAPAFVPITFESIVLFAAVSLFIALIVRLGLPRLWAPVDEVESFRRASLDHWWLELRSTASSHDAARFREIVARHGGVLHESESA